MEQELKAVLSCFITIATCFALSVVYLASLYVWKSPYNRDHPFTIKRRFISVFFMLFISPCFLYLGLKKQILEEVPFLELLGLKTKGIWQATILPLLLTMILFLGPISMEICNRFWQPKAETAQVTHSNIKDLVWLRNHLVAPFSEEFTYRSCMMPLLLQSLPPTAAIFINPLLFGVAHFHHMQERLNSGMDFSTALKISCFQFVYTSIFGMYSAYLLYKTGHFVSVFVVHAFCNHMGFPDLTELAHYEKKKKFIMGLVFVFGFLLWCFLLKPLTKPDLYSHSPTWYSI